MLRRESPSRTGAKVSLECVSHLLLDDPLLDQDLRDLGLAQLDDGLHLVAGTGPAGGLISWRLGEGAPAILVDAAHFTGSASSGMTGLATPVGAPGQQSLAFGTAPMAAAPPSLRTRSMATARSARCSRSPNCRRAGGVSALVSASVGGLETLFVADTARARSSSIALARDPPRPPRRRGRR
ncbi:MAG: hypothetical protein U5K36_05570 [Roseovarius sp.]|nr:hypothetical protein [Roseovarius sp.]